MTEDFDDVRDALDALVEGRISAERVREEFGDVDDIDYSISVAVARREQDLDDEDWQGSFGAEFELDWPDADEEEERERLADVADEELRDELKRIDDEIAEWRDVYDVETPDELREAINEEIEPDVRERRLEVAYDWEYNLYTRRLILSVAYRRNADRAAETNEEWSSVRMDGIDCCDSDGAFADDLETFLRRHGLPKLLEAYEATIEYRRENKTLRMAADDVDLDAFEGMVIIDLIEEAIDESDHELVQRRFEDL